MRNVVRWTVPPSSSYGTLHLWRGSMYGMNEDSAGTLFATVFLYNGGSWTGTYQDTAGSINDFYAYRYYDGTAVTPWGAKVLANAGPSYCTIRDLYDAYDRFDQILKVRQGTNDVGSMYFRTARVLNRVKQRIDAALRVAYPTPILPNAAGVYDEPLVEANVYLVLADLLRSTLADQEATGASWSDVFREQGTARLADLVARREVLSSVVSFQEVGVGSPVPAWENRGFAVLHSDQTHTYTPGDAQVRTFTVQIDGAGAVGTATFRWSLDGGRTWEQSGATTSDLRSGYVGLGWNVRLWWDKGADSTLTDCVVGDQWTIKAVPVASATEGDGLVLGELFRG